MIAPSVRELALPKLALDFTKGPLDGRITFSRATNATNPATYVASNGYITLATNDEPRFDYSLITLLHKGLLVEESRANFVLNSVFAGGGSSPTSFTQPSATGTSVPVTSLKSTIGVAYLQTATSERPYLNQAIAVTAGTTYCISMVIESTTGVSNSVILGGSGVTVTQYYANGVPVTGSTSSVVGVLSAVFTAATTTSLNIRFGLGINQTITGTLQFSCPQVETGAFPTSYIPTTTTALTRNADVATITGTNFSSFWQASRGGVLVRALPSTVSGTRPLVQFDDGTANEIIALRGNTTNPELYIVDGGTPQAQIDAGTIAANTAYSLTGWWQPNFCAARKDNGARVEDPTATIPTVTQMRIGSDGTNYLNGHLASISYYDKFSGQVYDRRKNKAVFSVI